VSGHCQPVVLGIDLGTSGVKVVVASADGDVLGRAGAGYPVSRPAPGQAEADPRDWWAAVRQAVPAALAEAGDPEVAALGVTGQMHGIVLVDECGAALRPAILRLDRRAADELELYAGLPGDYTAPLGNRPSPGMAGPLLCWLAAHEPHTLRHSCWALQPKDWLRLRLTGQAATEPTDASGTLLFDLDRDAWSGPLIGKLGLPRDKLPPLRRSAQAAGRLRPGPAAELGLPAGIAVAAGAGDTAAALFAAGLSPGDALLLLGRDGQWAIPVEYRPDEAPASATSRFRAVGDGCYRLAPVPGTGITLDRVRHLHGATWDELYASAARPPAPARPPDPGGHLRAALDTAAARLRQGLGDLRAAGHQPRRVVLGGGGARHPAWRALLGETLGLPLVPAPARWLAPAGAARLAAAVAYPAPPPPSPTSAPPTSTSTPVAPPSTSTRSARGTHVVARASLVRPSSTEGTAHRPA
jgi:xylulokinase